MAKTIKIRVEDIDNLVFSLLEDAKKGDIFSLKTINEFDFSHLQNELKMIENKIIENLVKIRLEDKKFQWKEEYQNSLEFKNLQNQLEKYKNDYINSQTITEREINNLKLEYNTKLSQKDNQLEKINISVNLEKEKIETLYKNKLNEQQKKLNDLQLEYDSKLLQKNNEFEKIKIEFQNKLGQQQNEKQKIILTYENEKNKLENKIQVISREKVQTNIKLLGEDLENWIENTFHNYFGMKDNIKIEKTTKPINGSKPDFLITIFNEFGDLQRIVIEAKTESTKGKVKNDHYYDALSKNCHNFKGDFALLISELEKNNDFKIVKVPDYKKMYVLRPEYFSYFIDIILELSLKEAIFKQREIEFKEKKEIIDDWEDFKNKIITSFINVEKKVDELIKESEKIDSSSKKIKELITKIWTYDLEQLKNKINNFKLEKQIINNENLFIKI